MTGHAKNRKTRGRGIRRSDKRISENRSHINEFCMALSLEKQTIELLLERNAYSNKSLIYNKSKLILSAFNRKTDF